MTLGLGTGNLNFHLKYTYFFMEDFLNIDLDSCDVLVAWETADDKCKEEVSEEKVTWKGGQ